MTDWIGETFRSSAGWSHLETLVNIGNRMAGSDGERKAAEATRDALEEHANGARLEEFPLQGWTRGSSAIHVGGATQDCIALPRSPPGTGTGDLIDVGHGLPEDFADADLTGKVALARSDVPEWYDRYIHRREKYYRAVEAGAVAFVYRNHVAGCLPPTGSVGTDENPIGEIPAVGVSKEVGARLDRRYEGTEVTVDVTADAYDATSQNVHATLGPDTHKEVYVTSHVDAHDIAEGAGDNGAGTALVVEIARALAARSHDLETTVHFVCYGAEEVGLVGSGYHAERTDTDGIKAVVNNDGVVRGRTLSFYTHGFDELDAAVERVADRFDHPFETIPRMGPHSDHWPYVQWGTPGYQVTSETGDQGRGWGHTYADTIDKLESRNLRESAILLTDLVVDLARSTVSIPHRDSGEIARALEAQDLAEGMRLTGDWPY